MLPASKTTAYEVRVSCFGNILRLVSMLFPRYWEEEIVGIKKSRNVMSLIRNSMIVVGRDSGKGNYFETGYKTTSIYIVR